MNQSDSMTIQTIGLENEKMNSNENVTIKGSRLTHPEKIRMVVCDLDGTLLYRPSSLSENAKEIIRKIRKQGFCLESVLADRSMD